MLFSTNLAIHMAFRLKLNTRLLLSSPRSYLITPEGSRCPLKLTKAQREEIASTWRKVQDTHRIGRTSGILYSRPA